MYCIFKSLYYLPRKLVSSFSDNDVSGELENESADEDDEDDEHTSLEVAGDEANEGMVVCC